MHKTNLKTWLALSIICVAPAGITAIADGPPVQWQKTFGGSSYEWGYSVQQTSDGGFIIAGYTDSFGAGNHDVYLIKTDSSGTLLWQKTFGGSNDDWAYSVQQTSDGGYIIAGQTQSFGTGGDVYLIKTDSAGNLLWQKTFGGSNTDDYAYSVQQTTDGGYIIAGTTFSFGAGNSDVYLIKTDSGGNSQWQKTFGGSNYDEGRSVQQTADGGYIVAGWTNSFGDPNGDVSLIKTDSEGNSQWQKTFGGSNTDYGYSVQQTSDCGYIIAGSTGIVEMKMDEENGWIYLRYKYFDVYLLKTDSNGNLQWQKTFGGSNYDEGRSVQQTADGGYIVAGETDGITEYGYDSSGYWTSHRCFDAYLLKTDPNGNSQWQKTFGGSNEDYSESVQQTSDGGFIIAGTTYSFGAGNGDVYLIKVAPESNFFAIICGNDERGQRFGADAQAIRDVLLEYPDVDPNNLNLVANPTNLQTTVAEVVKKLQPGDQFWLYYSGHGCYGYDGTEPPIWNSPLVALYTKDLRNEGDEYLAFGSNSYSDDLLTSWLSSNPKMKGVQKVVILDSCMSGGFGGREGNQIDNGDLDKLQNVGLLAACGEGDFAFSYPDWSWLGERRGRGIFSFALERQLRHGPNGIAPADLNGDGAVSFQELRTAMNQAYTMNQGDVGVIRTFPWLEEDIEVEISSPDQIPQVSVNYAIDFDPNVPILPKTTIGDLNDDEKADFTDYAIFANQWFQPPGLPSADISPPPHGDGIVNFLDLAIFVEHWLEGTMP
jgi:hypothetical protein